jgi:hypothetical protein
MSRQTNPSREPRHLLDNYPPTRVQAPTNDDLVCALIFIVSVTLLIFI